MPCRCHPADRPHQVDVVGLSGFAPQLHPHLTREVARRFNYLYGREPEVEAVHAGLECGIIGERFPGMDMVSFGPTLEEVHSPEERIYIDTVERFWDYLLAILKNI